VPGLLHAFFYDPNPTFGASPTPFIVLMIMGFVVGVIGHIVRAKGLVALGIAMIFLATFLLPLVTNVLKSQQ
jgi:F0F1-type ATP synthase assembly protein I